ncbi:hypothetical protein [Shewanella sp. UCD-KL12]|uniref:hypothetical protein n=1 Tax=Shewanella sp. UCD-KL12 TaxID=1917163 RepID=UPI000971491A|nr:hypothetical protein [Shewanella sp. UCD-KL12]
MPSTNVYNLPGSLANFTDKQVAWLSMGLLFLLILMWDGASRLYVGSDDVSSQNETQAILNADNTLLDQQVLAKVNQLYANYDLPEPEQEIDNTNVVNKPKPGMSEAEQLAQQGRLDKLFIDDNEYRLSGIFWDKQYFAVLIKTDVKTSESEELRVAQQQMMGSYTIQTISQARIEFVNGERTIILSMFD